MNEAEQGYEREHKPYHSEASCCILVCDWPSAAVSQVLCLIPVGTYKTTAPQRPNFPNFSVCIGADTPQLQALFHFSAPHSAFCLYYTEFAQRKAVNLLHKQTNANGLLSQLMLLA